MSAWADYLAAATQLDEVRRADAGLASQRSTTVRATLREVAELRRRIAGQRSWFTDLAGRAGVPTPRLVPDPTDLSRAVPVDAQAGPASALRDSRAALDAADASLAGSDRSRGPLAGWPAGPRNALVYGGFAVIMAALPMILYTTLSGSSTTSQTVFGFAELCGFPVLPAIGYGLAFLLIGALARPRPGDKVQRTPVLGAAVTALTAVLLYGGYLVWVTGMF